MIPASEVRLGLSSLVDGRYNYKIHTLQRIHDTAAETSSITIRISGSGAVPQQEYYSIFGDWFNYIVMRHFIDAKTED